MSLKEIWWYLVAIIFLLSGVQIYWCHYLYFTTGGEKIYINQVRKPNKIKGLMVFIKHLLKDFKGENVMEKQGISRFLPYEADYQTLSYCRNWTGKMLWLVAGLSVILPLISYLDISVGYNIFNCVYFVLIILYYVLDMYTETFLYPATARKRRKGFIDNSLGSKFLDKQVKGYYSNDALEDGPFKMLVNCGENCFFTLNIAKKMIPSVIIKNVIACVGFLIVAYVGIQDNLIAIPILQILLSALFFTEMIHHFNFIAKLSQIYERIQELFRNKVEKDTMFQEAVLIFLDYETTLAYNKAPLSDSVYKAENKRLTADWEEIKRRYEI